MAFFLVATTILTLSLATVPFTNGIAQEDLPASVKLISHLEIRKNGVVRSDVSDIWGYVDQRTGREYALVGYGVFRSPPNAGVSIVDVTDPAHPFQVADFDSMPGFDLKVWDHYLYSVSGVPVGEGKIADISDPANPRLVRSFPSAHNIFISEKGFLYLASPGLSIYALHPDPTYPMFVWDGGVEGHDAAIIGNRLFDFHGTAGTNIYDISDPFKPQILGSIQDPMIAYHHSGWTTTDGRYLFICDELARHPLPDITIWDISNPANPQRVAEYADTTASVHNLYIVHDYAYISYYTAGFVVLDVSDPTEPEKIFAFDTAPESQGEGFAGAFGVYPFGPSGNIYVSDFRNGLFVFSSPKIATSARTQRSGTSPSGPELFANYPNPFNPETRISFNLPRASDVTLGIFNTLGEEIRTLVVGETAQGRHEVVWDGRDEVGREAPSGIYFYRFEAEGSVATRRMVLLR